MARPARHSPEGLLDLARTTVMGEPDVTVKAFRATHQCAMGDARAALEAAKWEIRHHQCGVLARGELDARYRNLVRRDDSPCVTDGIELGAAPAVLRENVERAVEEVLRATTGVIEAMRATAQRLVAEAEAGAATAVQYAREHEMQIVADVEHADRQTAEARAETSQVRQEAVEKIAQLEQALRDVRVACERAEQGQARAEDERKAAVNQRNDVSATLELARSENSQRTAALASELAAAKRLVGAAEQRMETLQAAVNGAQVHISEATKDARSAREEAQAAAETAAETRGRLETLVSVHAEEIRRLTAAHGDEVRRLEGRLATRK